MELQEPKPSPTGQDLIDRVIKLQKTVQRAFRLFVGFFVFTFLYFTAAKIHEQGEFVFVEILIRFVFMIAAISIAHLLTRQIKKQYLKYVKMVQERELQLSFKEQSKASLLANLSEGILEYDIGRHQWMTVTTPFLSIFRLDWFKFIRGTRSESPMSSWYSLIHPDDLSTAKVLVERRLGSTGVDRCQMRMINNLNETRVIDVGLASIIEAVDRGILIISHRDVTEVMKTEQQKQLLTSIVEQSPDASWIFDDEGMSLYISPSAEQLIEQSNRFQCRELEFMSDPIAIKSQLLANIDPQSPYRRILQLQCDDPASTLPRFVVLSGFSAARSSSQYHVVTVKDITEAYQREIEVKSLKDRMELALGAANIGVWEWDLSTQQMSWDSHLYDLFELNPQTVPTYEFLLSRMVAEDAVRARNQIADAIEQKEGLILQFRIKTSRGIVHVKGVSQQVQADGQDNPLRLFGIFWDVTQEMNAREELAQSQARQQNSARLAALGEMASGVAHEINNPLSVISARASILRSRLKTDPTEEQVLDYQAALESIESNVLRISKIIKGLRNFSRDGDQDPFQHHDLQQLIEDTLGICAERFRTQQIELKVINRCGKNKRVVCRGVQIAQVLINLVNNAYDACVNSDQKRVQLEVFENEEGVHFLITDTGAGIPPQLDEKIMQPFFTTKTAGKGTGLGLSISQAIMREHQGKLYLDRAIASSCFHVVIPPLQPTVTTEFV